MHKPSGEDDNDFGIPWNPTRSYSKHEIESIVRRFIENYLESGDSGTLYIFFKQLEYGAKVGGEILRDQAFGALGYSLGGATSGKIMGHEVVISWPREWQYSTAVEDLKLRQKAELVDLQDQEKATGIARQVVGKGKIVVTLRGQ